MEIRHIWRWLINYYQFKPDLLRPHFCCCTTPPDCNVLSNVISKSCKTRRAFQKIWSPSSYLRTLYAVIYFSSYQGYKLMELRICWASLETVGLFQKIFMEISSKSSCKQRFSEVAFKIRFWINTFMKWPPTRKTHTKLCIPTYLNLYSIVNTLLLHWHQAETFGSR